MLTNHGQYSIAILALTAAVVAALYLSPWAVRRFARRLRTGDVVRISGGHEDPAPWLSGQSHVKGRVVGFVAGSVAAQTFAIIRLEEVLEVARPIHTRGEYAVLGLRFRGARWGSREVVAVWLEKVHRTRSVSARTRWWSLTRSIAASAREDACDPRA